MATRTPLVLMDGQFAQLQAGDTLAGVGGGGSATPSIAVTTPAMPSATDLTTVGTDDWMTFGNSGLAMPGGYIRNRRRVGNLLTEPYLLLGNAVTNTNTAVQTLSWADGTPVLTGTGFAATLTVSQINNGICFSAPADTASRQLMLYFFTQQCIATVTARLSDNSLSDSVTTYGTTAAGFAAKTALLTYNASRDGQRLSVSLEMTSQGGSPFLYIFALYLTH